MQESGAVDVPAFKRLLDFHIENATHAVVVAGTTGESATLDMGEHCQLIRDAVEHAAGRIPIIAGTGANSTTEAIALTRCAQQAGADACLLVTPYYNKPTQEGLYLHHKAVAEAVDVPQILYNVPGRTACDMLPETVARLAVIPNIIGIKEATGDLDRSRDILSRCGEQIEVYSGDDATALDLILLGARGNISVTANIAPNAMSRMCEAALAGDDAGAREINDGLVPLHTNLFLESNPIPVKWAVARMGLMEGHIRLPLTELSESCQGPLQQAMQQAGILNS
ncbi:MAG: 4-hydroxy-tetrahydrodipicolinate synthase [Gammaproteobacteria bacterium]|nr:MAG: 4-hydroxy-tetrahydrodipicolinate synthase [Gammaproteobacteria bacterium]